MSPPSAGPCATCGVCCRSYAVPLCGYDIWLISTGQHLSPEQFVVLCRQEEPGRDGFLLEAGGTVGFLVLDKQGPFRPDARCVFLLHLADGTDRCGIYAHRPVICQGYPMSIWSGLVYQREDALCPPGGWAKDEPRRPAWRAAFGRIYMHFDIYHEVVARWNARVRATPDTRFALSEYYAYLLNVYDRLARLAAATGEETLVALQAAWPTIPRSGHAEAEVHVQAGAIPWLDYLLQARRIIDSFYPEIAPTPLLALLPAR